MSHQSHFTEFDPKKCRLTMPQCRVMRVAIRGYLHEPSEIIKMSLDVMLSFHLAMREFETATPASLISPTSLFIASTMRFLPYTHCDQGSRERAIQERAWTKLPVPADLPTTRIVSFLEQYLFDKLDPALAPDGRSYIPPRCEKCGSECDRVFSVDAEDFRTNWSGKPAVRSICRVCLRG